MDEVKFYKKINVLILLGEIFYIIIFGIAFYFVYRRLSGEILDRYLLLVIVVLYFISAFRYYLANKSMRYEEYFDNTGKQKINTKVYKSPVDKTFYFVAIILGLIMGIGLTFK